MRRRPFRLFIQSDGVVASGQKRTGVWVLPCKTCVFPLVAQQQAFL
jgi:hypothetical protein